MRIPNVATYAPAAAVALTAALAGCSGSPQMAPTPLGQSGRVSPAIQRLATRQGIVPGHGAARSSFMDPRAVGKPLIFVVDGLNSVAHIFLQSKSHKAVGQITVSSGFFSGTATDRARNLYLTDDSSVLVYPPPYTGTPATLQDAGNVAWDVAVSRAGVVGVANDCALPSCASNTGSVAFYQPGATAPCATVPVTANVQYAAFDKKGDLFFAGIYTPPSGPLATQGYSVIGEVKGACKAKKSTLLTTSNTIRGYAVHVDKADRIAILDYSISGLFTIYTYNHPKNGSLGSPVSTVPLTPPNAFIIDFAFVASGADLYTAEDSNSCCPGFSNEYDYPAGGAAESTVDVTSYGSLSGVAVTPPLVP